ncbi:MAG: thiamine pyrophosphate-binding protein [Planctomycetes bacterium]|nr:thiamine pyrophosphate-binding protein [Planctomycetota bacterium]
MTISRRNLLKAASIGSAVLAATPATDAQRRARLQAPRGWVSGQMSGADALVETLLAEGTDCVFGIPGAQENEIWDSLKTKRLPYLLTTHEFSAATMADGYARSTGKPGVMCIVPGPGLTNALTGLGEALLDSVPIVCIVGDVSNARNARGFQVHCLNHVALLQPVTKRVITATSVGDIADSVRQAFQLARAGEPGPVAVVIPYNLLLEAGRFNSGPLAALAVPLDLDACRRALQLLCDRRLRVGIYAGMGCMDHAPSIVRLAELLQAPVATSMSGKGVISETHPLSVGWGYGPQGTRTAQDLFRNHVDVVLALGVKFSEVSTGFYSLPAHRHLIHVDINQASLGRVMRNSLGVHADVGAFLHQAFEQADSLRRADNRRLREIIQARRRAEARINQEVYARDCVDPMRFVQCLRRLTSADALTFVDVTLSQYLATECFTTTQPRTFFNPTDNQAMGWSIPAALGAQKVHANRQTLTITGDGCFLMSCTEISTAARERLPVKFFVLDDQAYRYMQELQNCTYLRTTATILARLDYRSLAMGYGVAYQEIRTHDELEPRIRTVLEHNGPVLTRVVTDYRRRPVRWINAARARFIQELTPEQRRRFLARAASRALDRRPQND